MALVMVRKLVRLVRAIAALARLIRRFLKLRVVMAFKIKAKQELTAAVLAVLVVIHVGA